VYTEIAPSIGLERDGLTRLRRHYGDTDGVIVVTPDRLSRNAYDLLILQEEMTKHNVTLYSVKETVEHAYLAVLAYIETH